MKSILSLLVLSSTVTCTVFAGGPLGSILTQKMSTAQNSATAPRLMDSLPVLPDYPLPPLFSDSGLPVIIPTNSDNSTNCAELLKLIKEAKARLASAQQSLTDANNLISIWGAKIVSKSELDNVMAKVLAAGGDVAAAERALAEAQALEAAAPGSQYGPIIAELNNKLKVLKGNLGSLINDWTTQNSLNTYSAEYIRQLKEFISVQNTEIAKIKERLEILENAYKLCAGTKTSGGCTFTDDGEGHLVMEPGGVKWDKNKKSGKYKNNGTPTDTDDDPELDTIVGGEAQNACAPDGRLPTNEEFEALQKCFSLGKDYMKNKSDFDNGVTDHGLAELYQIFPDMKNEWLWSSSVRPSSKDNVYIFSGRNGGIGCVSVKNDYAAVVCVSAR